MTSADVPEDVVYTVVKAVFDNFDRFKGLHPAFANLSQEEMISGGLSEPMLDPAFGQLGRGFIAGIPAPVVVLVILFVAAFIVMKYGTYGRAMYAIGGNATASHLSALPVKRYQLIAYTLSGLSAGVADM